MKEIAVDATKEGGRTYHYVSADGAQWLVNNVLPEWLAPNMITVTGLSLVASSHVLMAFYAPDLNQPAPSWLYAWHGVSLMVYQVLDVADGKQARKTGNASPLGLLFDHGCDALNCVLSACTMAATLQMGSSYISLGLLLFPSLVFFMATFEEFYTGTLALPIINGPNEGLAIMYVIYFCSAAFGTEFWTQQSMILPSLQNNSMFLLCTGIGSAFAIGSNVGNVIQSLNSKKRSLLPALLELLPYISLIGLFAAWVFLSPTDVVTTHCRLFMWTMGLLFCKLVMHMMLAHLCDEPIKLLRKTLKIMFMVAFLAVVGVVPYGQEHAVAYLFFGLSLMAYLHMVYFVIVELSTILNIRCFVVKPKDKKSM